MPLANEMKIDLQREFKYRGKECIISPQLFINHLRHVKPSDSYLADQDLSESNMRRDIIFLRTFVAC